jgi:hypothetical protein
MNNTFLFLFSISLFFIIPTQVFFIKKNFNLNVMDILRMCNYGVILTTLILITPLAITNINKIELPYVFSIGYLFFSFFFSNFLEHFLAKLIFPTFYENSFSKDEDKFIGAIKKSNFIIYLLLLIIYNYNHFI